MRAYFEVYGCWLNKAECQIMKEILREHGWLEVARPEDADLIVICTCAVRAETELKMLRRIGELQRIVAARNAKLVVAGCLAAARPSAVRRVAPTAILLGPNALERIAECAEAEGGSIIMEGRRRRLPTTLEGIRYVIPIASGCLGECAFCIGRLARGRVISYPPEAIVEHIAEAVRRGAREIFLVAQDAAAYGADIGTSLVELVSRILREVPGDYWIRIGMMEPHAVMSMLGRLVRLYDDDRLYKFAHLPLQSGDDRVLKLMRRKYTAAEYVELVEALRSEHPELMLTTDVIVGFPGEDEKAFANTVKVIRRVEPDKVNVARYGERPGTPACLLKGVPEHVKKRRSRELSRIAEEIARRRNERLVGKTVRALITDYDPARGEGLGRTHDYRRVRIEGAAPQDVGSFVEVLITAASHRGLRGRLLARCG